MKQNSFNNKKIAILGLGRSGRSTALALNRRGADVNAWDDSPQAREAAQDSGVFIQDLHGINWSDVDELILSPGIPHHHPAPHPVVALAKASGLQPISDIEILFASQPHATYVGITGTNGKSTTTALTGHILKSAGKTCEIGGNIGIPVMELRPLHEDQIYVLEMSSYQLELSPTIHFDVSAILNISPDHLDRHGGLEGYINAKKLIYKCSGPSDTLVISVDDPNCLALYEELTTHSNITLIPISTQKVVLDGIFVKDRQLIDRNFAFDLDDLSRLKGQHNWQNALAAYAICKALGIASTAIVEGLISFPGLEHRQQVIKTWNNIRFVNDSKATNAEAVAQALACYQSETVYWLAGGRPKEGGITSLETFFPHVHHAFIYGEAQDTFAISLNEKVPYTRAKDLREATEFALKKALKDNKKESVIMLSPACSSFDQFKDFEVRGQAFCGYVEELTN